MNADLKTMMDADLVSVFADQADTATIQTQANVPVVSTSAYENQTTDDQGIMPSADLSLVVRTASLTVAPVVGTGIVVYRTKSYRITGIERHGDENAITIMLQAVTQ